MKKQVCNYCGKPLNGESASLKWEVYTKGQLNYSQPTLYWYCAKCLERAADVLDALR